MLLLQPLPAVARPNVPTAAYAMRRQSLRTCSNSTSHCLANRKPCRVNRSCACTKTYASVGRGACSCWMRMLDCLLLLDSCSCQTYLESAAAARGCMKLRRMARSVRAGFYERCHGDWLHTLSSAHATWSLGVDPTVMACCFGSIARRRVGLTCHHQSPNSLC